MWLIFAFLHDLQATGVPETTCKRVVVLHEKLGLESEKCVQNAFDHSGTVCLIICVGTSLQSSQLKFDSCVASSALIT